jgi:hypothetical protein
MPFKYSVSASTEAVGFIADGKFVGTMRLMYNFDFSKMESQVRKFDTCWHYVSEVFQTTAM